MTPNRHQQQNIRDAWAALNSPPRELTQEEITQVCIDQGDQTNMGDLLAAGAIVPFFDGTYITVNQIGWDL
jgi:hypothetical protein